MKVSLPSKRRDDIKLDYELIELVKTDTFLDHSGIVRTSFGEPSRSTSNADFPPLVIIGDEPEEVFDYIDTQRSSPESCLRPICIVGISPDAMTQAESQLIDCVLPPRLSREELIEAKKTLSLLHQQLQKLALRSDDLPLAMLQFFYSRGLSIRPVVDADSDYCYRYPVAEKIMNLSASEAREIIDDMGRHSVLDREHVDKVFTCPDCNSYRVSVKELCPDCSSSNLTYQTSIHHFRCGFIGPEKHFDKSSALQCPKCSALLRHIGVEYNRPGTIVTCENCNFWSSSPVLKAWCVSCEKLHQPDSLVPVDIHTYHLNGNTSRIAKTGSWSYSDHLHSSTVGSGHFTEARNNITNEADLSDKYHTAINSVILRIAKKSGYPVKIYRVELSQISLIQDDIEKLIALDSVKSAIKKITSDSLLCIEDDNDDLILTLHNSIEHRTPERTKLEKTLRNATGRKIRLFDITEKSEFVNSA